MHETEEFLNQALRYVLGSCTLQKVSMQGGGYVNTAAVIKTDRGDFFIKWNDAGFADMFIQEARGLELLHQTVTVQTPVVRGMGTVSGKSFLVQEYLKRGAPDKNYWTDLGEHLAALHLVKAKCFGLDHDNYIGRLPQPNKQKNDWQSFYREERLRAQLTLAVSNSFVSRHFVQRFESFLEKCDELMPASEPSFLHGDLWNGNVMPGTKGEAYFFDPAIYYGAREMDLAMTHLFGGFERRFYEAYDAVYPIPAHFHELVDLYNLYPLMVHVNLLGPDAGYVGSIEHILNRYL